MRWLVFPLSFSLASASCGDDKSCEVQWVESVDIDPATLLCDWVQHPGNPLIKPVGNETMIADPTIVPPHESPDERWHLFAWSFLGINHFDSTDGIEWKHLKADYRIGTTRPHLFHEDDTYYLFTERFDNLLEVEDSVIQVSTSTDLRTWTEPVALLHSELDWEKEGATVVGNPYVTQRDGRYYLYYSAGAVFLEEAGYHEPRHIGLAVADSIMGPYEKLPSPILSPSSDDPWRNLGAGSMKLLDLRYGGRYIALNNGIYRDEQGQPRSAIRVLSSTDGEIWQSVCEAPILRPTAEGWMKAFVYAFDTTLVGQTLYLYYNSRDEWMDGVERIGLATIELPCADPTD